MQYALQVFESEFQERFRVLERNGEPWFVAKDVAEILGYTNTRKAIRDHCKAAEQVGRNVSFPLDPQTVVIPERDLYRLIIRSKLPSAERFEEWVFGEVLPSIRKTGGYAHSRGTPAFISRYNDNWDRVDPGHWSIINELIVHFWGRLEHAGHMMADRAPNGTENRPDISAGRCFSDWLKKHHPTVSTAFSFYQHKTPEWEGEVRQYPFSLLPLFRQFLDDVWIPQYGPNYLRTRDPAALPFLQKLLPAPGKPKIGMMKQPTRLARKAS